ncbi:MAG: endonuclease NucS [Candidatus Woesearchaeota archaeon]
MLNLVSAAADLREAILKKECIILTARCRIRYSGRAESYLASGDRIIIIKSDGSMMVHQPSGSAPVNWMKEGSEFGISVEGGEIKIRVSNIPLKEVLDISVESLYSIFHSNLQDGEKLMLVGSERDMSDMIMRNPELIEKGFKPLSREEHTKYGFIDVFGYDSENVLVVVEAKRYSADFKAVSQLARYVDKIRRDKGLQRVRGILAAPSISKNAEHMLKELGFEFRRVEPPRFFEHLKKNQATLNHFKEG